MYNKKHPQAEGTDFETHSKFFWTPFWSNSIPEWVDEIDNACQVYLDMAHERESSRVEKNNGDDFGMVYHSGPIETDPKLKQLVDYVGSTAYNLLETWGNDLSNHEVVYDSMWVQEFSQNGGGHHRVHIHENCHVSGFYFLRNDNSSFPLFHDPRPGAMMTKLPEKNEYDITAATKMCNYQPVPGDLYMFPSYLPHEYVVSKGKDFRFIHFNLSAVSTRYFGEGGVL